LAMHASTLPENWRELDGYQGLTNRVPAEKLWAKDHRNPANQEEEKNAPSDGGLDEVADYTLLLVPCEPCDACPREWSAENNTYVYIKDTECECQGKHYLETSEVQKISKSLICRMSKMVERVCKADKETNICLTLGCHYEREGDSDSDDTICPECQGTEWGAKVTLSKVNGETLEHIVRYLKQLDGRTPEHFPKPITSTDIFKCVPKADHVDAKFIEDIFENHGSKRAIFDIMLAANYMDMKKLLHLGAVKIATLIKGKSPDEIKRILGEDTDDATNAAAGPRRKLLKKLIGF